MRHIRNFFHNISDIMLAILVVLIACGVIYWRMQIIMDYPRKYVQAQAAESFDSESEVEETSGTETEADRSTEPDGADSDGRDASTESDQETGE